MNKVTTPRKSVLWREGVHRSLILLLPLFLITSCSQIPDAVNPVEWYKSSIDFFSGQDREEAKPGVRNNFPDLKSVDRQQELSENREKGLIADKKGRQYTPEIARQGEAANVLNAPPPKPSMVVEDSSKGSVVARKTLPLEMKQSTPGTSTLVIDSESEKEVRASVVADTVISGHSRMAARLAEIKEKAFQKPTMAVLSSFNSYSDPIGTVIVSSNGVEFGSSKVVISEVVSKKNINLQHLSIKTSENKIAFGGIKVATILFANSSSSLSIKDRSILANVQQLQRERGGKIRIVGHASSRTRDTDPVSHKMINLKVSAARAEAVAQELIRMGVDPKKMEVDAVSDSTPVFYEYMPAGEAGNRRAEIFLVS